MTSEEIRAAIERLRAIELPYRYNEILKAFDVKVGTEKCFRDILIELLEQADPDTHMELPKDLYGKTIHIGDDVRRLRENDPIRVVGVGDDAIFYDSSGDWCRWGRAGGYTNGSEIERVLCELMREVHGYEIEGVAPKYADKIRELMANE